MKLWMIRVKFWKLQRRISDWLYRHMPVSCVICGDFHLRKNMKEEIHRVHGYVSLCTTCHQQIFGPFSKKPAPPAWKEGCDEQT